MGYCDIIYKYLQRCWSAAMRFQFSRVREWILLLLIKEKKNLQSSRLKLHTASIIFRHGKPEKLQWYCWICAKEIKEGQRTLVPSIMRQNARPHYFPCVNTRWRRSDVPGHAAALHTTVFFFLRKQLFCQAGQLWVICCFQNGEYSDY